MDQQLQEQLNLKKTLEYWIPGATIDQMKQKLNQRPILQFKEEEFLTEITFGKAIIAYQDDKYLSETEKAYLIAFNPDKRIRSDYECMFVSNDEKANEIEIETTNQKCENPNCPGTDTKWIECSEKKCWYHQSCAGIPLNKTQEEIDQMDWKCKKCKNDKNKKK